MQVMNMLECGDIEKVRSVMQQALDTVALQGVGGQISSAEEQVTSVPFLPPLKSDKYTLVLDLDETLVHYYETEQRGQYVIRPGMNDFLTRLFPYYELVVFTAAMQEYADWVLDEIDINHFISHRLYRQHTVKIGDSLVKDLGKLGRDVARTIIIDNVQESFQLNPGNGILIRSWFDDMSDQALIELFPLLKGNCYAEIAVKKVADVRTALQSYRSQIIAQDAQGIPQAAMRLRLE
jgi:CTD small phosphatase-like protein 2